MPLISLMQVSYALMAFGFLLKGRNLLRNNAIFGDLCNPPLQQGPNSNARIY